jgi:hypothetical protein
MVRRAVLGAAVAGAVLTLAPLGIAKSGSFSDSRGDVRPAGTTNPGPRYDIVRATEGHTSRGRLVHTITVAGNASLDDLYVFIQHSELPNYTRECRWFVGRFDGRAGVFTCGYAERVASARVRRTSSSTVRFEFSPSAIENVASYEWAAVARGPTERTHAYLDRLPTADNDFITHRLR